MRKISLTKNHLTRNKLKYIWRPNSTTIVTAKPVKLVVNQKLITVKFAITVLLATTTTVLYSITVLENAI